LRVPLVTADPVGRAASAAGMTTDDARDFRRLYDLSMTVETKHAYLVES